ncbi:hypothetical protein D3C75_1066600 [compost metagenome]
MPAHDRQQGAKQDEVVNCKNPSKEGNPSRIFDIFGFQLYRLPCTRLGNWRRGGGWRSGHIGISLVVDPLINVRTEVFNQPLRG